MEDKVESQARTLYWLEATINQGKEKCDWDAQDTIVKAEWRKCAKSLLRLVGKGE